MEEYYELKYENIDVWEDKYDSQKPNHGEYEKVTKSGNIYMKKVPNYMSDGRICNYEKAVDCYPWGKKPPGIRIVHHHDYISVEPAGIRLPRKNFKKLTDKSEIPVGVFGEFDELSMNTFFCNWYPILSRTDRINGYGEPIPYDIIYKFEDEFIHGNIETMANPNFLSAFDFVYMFCYLNFIEGNVSLDRDKLVDYIYETIHKPEYMRILWNINFDGMISEELRSVNIEKAIALLYYIGIIHPDYAKNNEYIDFTIDKNVLYLQSIYKLKSILYPEIIDFTEKYISLYTDNKKFSKKRVFSKKYNI